MKSLRRTLIVTLLTAVGTVTLAAALLVYRRARQEIDTIFDYHLRQIALTLRSQAYERGVLTLGSSEGFDFVVQIWDRDGTRVFVSTPESGLPEIAQMGFVTFRSSTGAWRAYSEELSGLVVQVAQPLRVRQQLAFSAASRTLTPILVVVPLLALLVWHIVGRALAPLERLAGAVRSRTPSSLDPIIEAGTPEEVSPLVRALNDLLGRLGTAIGAQRAFVADAAHELRTPLAALKLQVQLVERSRDESERVAALADLRAGLDRATHVVQQLLTLARAEPEAAAALAGEPVDLAELAGQAVADHALLAEAKGIDLGVASAASGATALGDPAALRTLLANLLDNAVRHSPEGGRVDVAVGIASGRAYLQVSDNGPGLPEEERSRVFDRFYRRGGAAQSGSGLGLAIVKAVAERHGAAVSLAETPGGGLTARVDFPVASSKRHVAGVDAGAGTTHPEQGRPGLRVP